MNYYIITLTNGQQMRVQTEQHSTTENLLKQFETGTFASNFVKFKLSDKDPLYVSKSAIMSVQKINEKAISQAHDKIWSLV